MSLKEGIKVLSKFVSSLPWDKTEHGKGFLDWLLKKKGRLGEVPLVPSTTRTFTDIVEEIFGKTCLTNEIEYNGCIAGAVAHQFNEDPLNMPDVLDIFDSKSEPQQLVSEVIVGSTTAPIYLEIPSQIGNKSYIDGAIFGNLK